MTQQKRIYRKVKTVDIDVTQDLRLRVAVSHDDPRHQMSLIVVFRMPELVIETIECVMLHIPHKECLLALSALEAMVGKRMRPGIVKQAMQKTAGKGCTHLNDLFKEACYSVIQGQGLYRRRQLEEMLPEINLEQITKIGLMLRPEMLDSCVAFNRQSHLMRSVKEARLPLDEDELRALLLKLSGEPSV